MLPAALHILLALTDGRRHGYAIKQEAEARSEGAIRLGPGTLYETIQKLLDARLIREAPGHSPGNGQEAQRRYYELTALGRRHLHAEVARLSRLVDYARSKPELA